MDPLFIYLLAHWYRLSYPVKAYSCLAKNWSAPICQLTSCFYWRHCLCVSIWCPNYPYLHLSAFSLIWSYSLLVAVCFSNLCQSSQCFLYATSGNCSSSGNGHFIHVTPNLKLPELAGTFWLLGCWSLVLVSMLYSWALCEAPDLVLPHVPCYFHPFLQ